MVTPGTKTNWVQTTITGDGHLYHFFQIGHYPEFTGVVFTGAHDQGVTIHLLKEIMLLQEMKI